MVASPAPVIGVSPIIDGHAVKGPTAKLMRELSLPSTAQAVAKHYDELLDGYVIDIADRNNSNEMHIPVRVTRTLMNSIEDRENLAREVLSFADTVSVREN
mgnify:FL=1